eukprot:COSAG05_NODE_1013_length_6190_cov_4.171236_9_plen_106_part_00
MLREKAVYSVHRAPLVGWTWGYNECGEIGFGTNFYTLTVCSLIHIYIYTKFQISEQTTNCGAKGHLPAPLRSTATSRQRAHASMLMQVSVGPLTSDTQERGHAAR